jgi:O-antigen/teichoic acid export membrane protein
MPDEQVTVPSTPDPQIATYVALAIRLIVTIAGTFGLSTAYWTSDKITAVAGAVAVLVGAAWSSYELIRQAQMRHAAAAVSARLGQARQYQDYKAVKKVVKEGV